MRDRVRVRNLRVLRLRVTCCNPNFQIHHYKQLYPVIQFRGMFSCFQAQSLLPMLKIQQQAAGFWLLQALETSPGTTLTHTRRSLRA